MTAKKLKARLTQTPIQHDEQFKSTIHSVLSDSLSEMSTKPELIALLKTNGIKGYFRKNKAELEAMLTAIPVLTPVATVAAGVSIKPKEDTIVEMTHSYDETISEVLRIAKTISVTKAGGDGRIDSAMKEAPFLEELKRQLLERHSTWEIIISPPRASCDIMVNAVRINLKLTDCKSSDNSVNKPSIFYSITGLSTYPYSSNWNEFQERLVDAAKEKQIKTSRHRPSEYHYLVKNKVTGDTLLKPIFDIHTYVSNASNDLQINWKNEFEHISETTDDSNYLKKVESLLITLQRSVREMIERTRKFAEADVGSLLVALAI